MHDNSPYVAYDFDEAAEDDTDHEPDLLPAETEIGMDQQGEGVEDDEDDVGGQAGAVAVDGVLERAEVEGAVCGGAEDDDVRREAGRGG